MRAPVVNEGLTLPNVVIDGRPNVGKSALFNRLLGRKIAIVHDQPGITRDRLSGICTRGERVFTLWDTGGILGAGESDLTQQIRSAAENAFRDSDILLFVVDAKEGLSPVDKELARMLRKSHKPIVLVINKIDSEKHDSLAIEFDSLGFKEIISISAEHDRGISELLDAIERRLPSPANVENRTLIGRSLSESGSNLANPLAIAIVGRPNVGKSSLINSIVRSERAIVSELPGTTRDAIDMTMGVTAQDKRIAGLIQKAQKPAIVVLNKWDLIKPRRGEKQSTRQLTEETRSGIFFLNYAPVLITSASTGENVDRLFVSIQKIQHAARKRISTGVLNRLLRQAFEANPPPLVKGKRLKLFYAAQTTGDAEPSAMERGAPARPELVHAMQTS